VKRLKGTRKKNGGHIYMEGQKNRKDRFFVQGIISSAREPRAWQVVTGRRESDHQQSERTKFKKRALRITFQTDATCEAFPPTSRTECTGQGGCVVITELKGKV